MSGFAALNDVRPVIVSQAAFMGASLSNQLIASISGVGGGTVEAFKRGAFFALVHLEASAKVALWVPGIALPTTWTSRLNLSGYSLDHVPLLFTDGIRIVVPATVQMDAVIVQIG